MAKKYISARAGALASTTSATTTTPQIENLIGRVRKNRRSARAVRASEQPWVVLCKITVEITTFVVFATT